MINSHNGCPPYTEIFSKRRKIYSVCKKSLLSPAAPSKLLRARRQLNYKEEKDWWNCLSSEESASEEEAKEKWRTEQSSDDTSEDDKPPRAKKQRQETEDRDMFASESD